MELEVYFEGKKQVIANLNGTIIKTDQPISAGGEGMAPTPFELFLGSIGTCAGIFVKGFCDNRGIDSSKIKIIQRHQFNPATHLMEKIELEAILPDDFPEKYKNAVIQSMDLCLVKRHFQNPPEIITKTNLG